MYERGHAQLGSSSGGGRWWWKGGCSLAAATSTLTNSLPLCKLLQLRLRLRLWQRSDRPHTRLPLHTCKRAYRRELLIVVDHQSALLPTTHTSTLTNLHLDATPWYRRHQRKGMRRRAWRLQLVWLVLPTTTTTLVSTTSWLVCGGGGGRGGCSLGGRRTRYQRAVVIVWRKQLPLTTLGVRLEGHRPRIHLPCRLWCRVRLALWRLTRVTPPSTRTTVAGSEQVRSVAGG